jgi:putative phage-type endonuclease
MKVAQMLGKPNPLQGGGDWLEERAGCATASRMRDLLDFRKDGKPGAKRLQYMKELVAERMTGNSVHHHMTQTMADGIEREPFARELYEDVSGNDVVLCGFVRHPTIEFAGASPDGLVGHEGLIEIKCPTAPTFVDWLIAGTVPEEHMDQMMFQLACTRRRFCDFVAYHPDMIEGTKRLFVRRFEPSQGLIATLEDSVRGFLVEVEQLFTKVTTA